MRGLGSVAAARLEGTCSGREQRRSAQGPHCLENTFVTGLPTRRLSTSRARQPDDPISWERPRLRGATSTGAPVLTTSPPPPSESHRPGDRPARSSNGGNRCLDDFPRESSRLTPTEGA